LTKSGSGILTLTGANSYSGATNINVGTLRSGASDVLPNASNVAVTGTGTGLTATLDLNGFNDTIGTLTLGGTTTTSGAAVQTGAGTLTLGGNVTYSATNNPLGATISGKLDLGAATRTFDVGNSTTAADDLTISAVISGGSGIGLTKATGAGLMVLSGANTYGGPTTINAGTVRLDGGADRLPTGTAVTLANTSGVILNLNNNSQTIASLSGGGTSGGNVQLGTATLTVGDNTSTAYSGVISGTGGNLVKQGTGTLTVGGASTYTGTTWIKDGVLVVGVGNDRLPIGTAVTLGSGTASGIMRLGDGTARNQTITGLVTSGTGSNNRVVGGAATGSTLTLNLAADNTYDGFLGGSGTNENNLALTKTGAGKLVLTNTGNSAVNGTTINQGTLQTGTSGVLADGGAVSVSATVAGFNAVLDLDNNNETIASLTLGGNQATSQAIVQTGAGTLTVGGTVLFNGTQQGGLITGKLDLGGATRQFNIGNSTNAVHDLTVQAVISGGSGIGISKTGAGMLTLSAGNTYAGTTTVTQGTLLLNHANALPGGTSNSGGTSNVTFNGTPADPSGTGVIGLGAGDFTRSVGTGVNQIQWASSGNGSGGFAAFGSDRIVRLSVSPSDSNAASLTWNSGNFVITGQSLVLGSTLVDRTVDFQNDINLNAAARTVQVENGSAGVDGILSGTLSGTGGGLTKSGAGGLLLTGSNSYTGVTTVTAGHLLANSLTNGGTNSAIGASTSAAANLVISSGSGGTFRLVGSSTTTDRQFTAGASGTIDANPNTTLKMAGWTQGAVTFNVGGSGGTLDVGAGSITAGTATLNTSNSIVRIASITPTTGNPAVTLGGTGIFNTISGSVSTGSGLLTVNGGQWTMLGARGSSGATTLSGNTALNVQHVDALGTTGSLVTVGSGTTLELQGGIAVNSLKPLNINGIGAGAGFGQKSGALVNVSGNNSWNNTITLAGASIIASNRDTLTLNGNITTAGNALTLGGAGNGQLASTVTYGNSTGSLVKIGTGTWTLSGTVGFSGATTLNNGRLVLDYTAGNNNKFATGGALNLGAASSAFIGGGTIELSAGSHVQQVGSTVLNIGGSTITRSSGTSTLRLNAITTRNIGSTLDLAAGSLADTDSTNINGLLGGGGAANKGAYATVGKTDWAMNSTGAADGAITAYTGYTVGLPASGASTTTNYSHSGSLVMTATQTANSLKLATTANGQSLNIGASRILTFTSGGLLFIGGHDYSIDAGTLNGAAGGDLIVHQHGTGTLTINSVVSSSTSGLTKTGAGTLVLTNNNTYGGITAINEGIVVVKHASALGPGTDNDGGGTYIQPGTTLRIEGVNLVGERIFLNGNGAPGQNGALVYSGVSNASFLHMQMNSNSTISVDSGSLILQNIGTMDSRGVSGPHLTVTGAGTGRFVNYFDGLGTGALIKNGSGTWEITRNWNAASSGGLHLNAGRLTADYSDTNLLNTSAGLFLSGGTLRLTQTSGGVKTVDEQVLYSVLSPGGSDIEWFNGGVASTLNLRTGAIVRLVGGTLHIDNTNAAGGAVQTNASNVHGILGFATITNGSTVDWGTSDTLASNTPIVAYTGYTPGLPGSGASATTNYSLTGSQSVTASETANSLKLSTSAGGQSLGIGAGQTLTLASGGLLFVGGNDYAISGGTLRGADSTDLIVHHYGAGNLTIGSVIANNTGTTALTKTGPGKVTLTGENTYTGPTYINGGTLSFSDNKQLGAFTTGSAVQIDNGTLQATSSLTLDNGGLNKRNIIIGGNGATFDVTASNVLSVTGTVSPTRSAPTDESTGGGLTKIGAGTLSLADVSSYTGVTRLSSGVLLAGHASALPGGLATTGGTSGLTFEGGVLGLGVGNFSRNLGTDYRQVQWTGSGGFAAYAADRTVNLGGSLAPLTWNAGNFVPTGSSLILGSWDATHTVEFQNAIAMAGAARTVQADNGAASVDGRISGVLSGDVNSSLNKTGLGTLELTAANTYGGTTTVSAGTLRLTGTHLVGGSYTIAAGATLEGTGTTTSLITGAGLVSPGTSPGILTAGQADPSGGLDWGFEFTGTLNPDWSQAAASINDVLRMTDASTPITVAMTGANVVDVFLSLPSISAGYVFRGGFYTDLNSDFLSLIAGATYDFWVWGDGNGNDKTFNGLDYYSLANYNSNMSLTVSTFQVPVANFVGGSVNNGWVSQFTVTEEIVSAVPEPSTWVLAVAALAGVGLLAWRRRPS